MDCKYCSICLVPKYSDVWETDFNIKVSLRFEVIYFNEIIQLVNLIHIIIMAIDETDSDFLNFLIDSVAVLFLQITYWLVRLSCACYIFTYCYTSIVHLIQKTFSARTLV